VRKKNSGTLAGVPVCLSGWAISASSSCRPFSCHPSWLPWFYSPFPFFMDATNVPLQLIECIESMKNDVKRKIGMRDHHRAMSAECEAQLWESDERTAGP
jgi:hypothetical protein